MRIPYASDLIECAHCGSPITGERKFKMTKSGEREYVYYRCTQYYKGDHPRIRLTENELDAQMLAGHSITCANALNLIFRNVSDPATRHYALLEAVEWTTSFLKRERARPALRDRDLFKITPAALSNDGDALETIFKTIPIRRRRQFSPVLLPQNDRAQELALRWATTLADHSPFFRRALRLLCIKATTEVHDFKYPLALFENYRHASPEWKPHLLAASVYVIHGTQIEDAPIVAEARARIG